MLMNPLSLPVEDNAKSESVSRVEDEKGSRKLENVSIENAIKATGHGKFHTILLLVCGFGMMGVVVENVNIGFVLPYIRCEMGISTTEQGFLNSVGYIGIVLSSHFWGFLADTSGRRQVLIASMTGSFISAVLSTLSFSVIILIVSRFFVGIFVAGVQAATYSYIGEFHSNDTRTRALSFVSVFMPLCFIYLPLLAYFIIPMQWKILIHTFIDFKISPWRLYLFCSSILNGINLICLYKLPESPKFLLSISRKKSAVIVLKQMYAVNTGKDPETYPIEDIADEQSGTALSEVNGISGVLKLAWNQTWPLFMPPHLGKTIKLCYLMFVLFSIGHGTFMWYPDFLTRMQDYVNEPYTLCQVVSSRLTQSINSRSELGKHESPPADVYGVKDCNIDRSNTLTFEIIFVMGIAFVSISALISFYIDKVDRKKLLICWLVLCAAFAFSISAIPQFYVMAICFMIFLSCGLCGGIISAISVALFPTNIRAMATCLILMFGRLGAVSGSNFVGFLLNTNCELIFYLYGALLLSCAALCFFLNINPTEKKLAGENPTNEMKCEC